MTGLHDTPTHPWLVALALFVLAIKPVHWLLVSGSDPSYDAVGAWVFVCCVGLFIASLHTKRRMIITKERKVAAPQEGERRCR